MAAAAAMRGLAKPSPFSIGVGNVAQRRWKRKSVGL
jgi:hypothetical protein